MKALKKFNIFTFLLLAASIGFAFRLVNVATFSSHDAKDIGIIMSAGAVEEKTAAPAEVTDDDTPPLTRADIEKSLQAAAKDVEALPAGDGVVKNLPPESGAGSGQAPLPENRAFSTSELDVLQSLSKRREELDQRERNLNESAALLKAAEQEVDRKVAELNKLKGEIEALLGQQEKMEDARITSLVKIYENMKPKEAATIFNTLDMDVLLSVVGRMNERKLSPILASMEPEKARIVTIRLAEQRQLPPGAPAPAAPATPPAAPTAAQP